MKRHLLHFSLFLGFLLLLTGCSRKVVAVEEGWDLLGQSKVDFLRDKDEIVVTNHTLYSALQFKVEDRDIRISYLKVHFDNGDKLEPAIDDIIEAGRKSRIIELGEQGRYITKVEFKYRTTGSILRGRADLILFGKRYYSGF